MPVLCHSFVTASLNLKKKWEQKGKKRGHTFKRPGCSGSAWPVTLGSSSSHHGCSEAMPNTSQLSVRSCTESINRKKEQLGGKQEKKKKLRKMP